MEANDFVLARDRGIGRVSRVEKDGVYVRFLLPGLDRQRECWEDPKKLSVLPRKALFALLGIFERTAFDETTVEKSKEYVNLNAISRFEYRERNFMIRARVKGTRDYWTAISLKDGELACTCPVKGNCKHERALLALLAGEIDKDALGAPFAEKEEPKPVPEKRSFPFPGPSADLDRYTKAFIDSYLDVGAAIQLYRYLRVVRAKGSAGDYFRMLARRKFNESALVQGIVDLYILAAGESAMQLSRFFRSLPSSLVNDIAKDELENIRRIKTGYGYFAPENAYPYQYVLYQSALRGDLEPFYRSLVDSPRDLKKSLFLKLHLKDILKYALSDRKNDFVTFRMLLFLDEEGSNRTLLRELFVQMDEKTRRLCYPLLPAGFYELVDPRELAERLNDFKFPGAALSVIKRLFDNIPRTSLGLLGARLIALRKEKSLKPEQKEEIDLLLSRLPKSRAFDAYLKYSQQYYYTYSKSAEPALADRVPLSRIKLDDPDFFLYFDVLPSIVGDESKYIERIDISGKSGEILLEVDLPGDPDSPPGVIDHLDEEGSRLYARFAIAWAEEKNEAFKAELDRVSTLAAEKRKVEMDRRLLAEFDAIESANVSDATSTLAGDALVGIEYRFRRTLEGKISLGFRVGSRRLYVVSDAALFLGDFLESRFVSYGKDLAFQHKLENLRPEDRTAVSLLVSSPPPALEKGGRTLLISETRLAMLFSLLKGRTIYWNDFPYRLTLEEKNVRVGIDKDYVLRPILPEGVLLLPIKDVVYLLDEKEQRIDLASGGKIKARLLSLAARYKGASLARVRQSFLDKVFAAYPDDIELAPEIKDKFVLSELLIRSYFDIDDEDRITLRTAYLLGESEFPPESLTRPYDIAKKDSYLRLMEHLGFKDGVMAEDSDILNFLGMDMSELKKTSEVYVSESLGKKKLVRFAPPTLRMSYSGGTMSVFLGPSQYSDEELAEILSALKKKKKFALLKGERIVRLDETDAERFASLVDDLSLDKKKLSEPQEKPVYQSLAAFSVPGFVELDDYLKKMVEDIRNFKKAKYPLPSVSAELRPYQIEGYNWLKVLSEYKLGGVLADDMGLGKTLEIITLIAGDPERKPSLIVAPKSLVFNWLSEFSRFAPDITVTMIYGAAQNRISLIRGIKPDEKVVYLTSFDSLRNDVKEYAAEFNYLVLDEAQYIKNVHALKTQNVKKVRGVHRFALTGTPIENDIFDLWSIFDFLMPRYLPSLSRFKESGNDEDFQEAVAKRVTPFILRRTKREVLKDLPAKYERVLSAEMSEEQRKLYDAHRLKAREILSSGGKAFNVLSLLTRLRQICVDPRTFAENFTGKSGKTEMLKSLLREHVSQGHRVLVFSQFVTALNIVEDYLKRLKIPYFMITGATPGKERLEYVDRFNADDKVKVFLISLKAGGNGLNLTGADTVIHYDPWWNIAAENQATDRAYRIGQTKDVEVIRLIAEDSIEQRVIELQNKKKDLIDKLISEDTSKLEKISVDDLKFILR